MQSGGQVVSPTLGASSRFQMLASSSARVHDDTEMAFAELQVMSQNQRRLAHLTSRMTTILSGFDKRLVQLEGSILPIHKGTQTLARTSDNIDLTLAALNKTLGHYDVVLDEQPILEQGPDIRDTRPYIETMERVMKGLQYLQRSDLKSQDGVVKRMEDLVELGARHLVNVVSDWIGVDSEFIDLTASSPLFVTSAALSDDTLDAVVPIVNFLSTLPRHPRTGYSPLAAGLSSYASVRSKYLEDCLSPLFTRLHYHAVEEIGAGASGAGMVMVANDEDEDQTGSYRRGESSIAELLETVCAMLANEFRILQNLFSSAELDKETLLLASTYSQLTAASLDQLVRSLASVHSHIRRHMSTHTGLLLDLIAGLSSVILSGHWDQLISKMEQSLDSPLYTSIQFDKSSLDLSAGFAPATEVLDIYDALKNTAIGIFPRFIEDVKAIPVQRGGEVPSTSVNEITYMGLQFVRMNVEYGDVVAPLLQKLGNGNWMMASGTAPVLSLGLDSDPGKQSILADYLNDVVAVVLTALEARSRAIRQPSTASIFLLNNIGHLRRTVSKPLPAYLFRGEGNTVGATILLYLGEVGDDLLGTALRQATTAYLDAWTPVISPLMDEQTHAASQYHRHATSKLIGVGSGSEKNQVKDRFAKFYEGLDDLQRLHRAYPFSKEDQDLTTRLQRDVTRLVCPLYSRFLNKAGDFITKNPSKHIRLTEAEVEDKIASMFL